MRGNVLLFKAQFIVPLPAIYFGGNSIIEYKATARLLSVTLDQNLGWIPHLKEVSKNFGNKLSLLRTEIQVSTQIYVCESFYVKVIQPTITVWAEVTQTELFKTIEKTTLLCC